MEPTQPTSEQPKDEASRLRDIINQSNTVDGKVKDLSQSVRVNIDPTLENLESTKEQLRMLKAELEILKDKVSEYQAPLEKSKLERQAAGNRIFAEITKEEIINQLNSSDFLTCLTGIGSPESMNLRERIIANPKSDKKQIAMSLVRVGTPESIQMRRLLLTKRVPKSVVLKSLAGATSEEAMEMRKMLYSPPRMDDALLESLSGIDTPEAMEMRQKILDRAIDKFNPRDQNGIINVVESLNGLSNQESMAMRQQLFNFLMQEIQYSASFSFHPIAVRLFTSLAYIDTDEAMKMRKNFSKTIEPFTSGDRSESVDRYILDSLKGVGSEESMTMRRKVLKLHSTEPAPINNSYKEDVVRSLFGVESAASFQMRKKFSKEGFSKEVLLGLVGIDTRDAINMRKELLSLNSEQTRLLSDLGYSLIGAYSDEAFELRRQELNQEPKLFAKSILESDLGVSERVRICRHGWEK